MSLINELRGIPSKAKHEEEVSGYNPVYLNVINKKGFFLISPDSLDIEKMECFRKEHISFEQWLKNNQLKIIGSGLMNGYFKIYR